MILLHNVPGCPLALSAAGDLHALTCTDRNPVREHIRLLCLSIKALPPALDVQLRQRTSQSSIDRSHFFGRNLLSEAGFSALTRFFDLGLIDFVGSNGHIRNNRIRGRP